MTEPAPDKTARTDQRAAAAAHAQRHSDMFRKVPEIGGATEQPIPAWFRQRLNDCELASRSHRSNWCQHLVERPVQPWIMGVWKPGTVACADCAPEMLAVFGDAENTCDGCRVVFPQGLRPMMVTERHFVVYAGACRPCSDLPPAAEDVTDPTPVAPPRTGPLHPLHGIAPVLPLDVSSLTDPPPVNYDGPSCGYQVPCPPWPDKDTEQ